VEALAGAADLALVGLVVAGEHLDERRLPRPVGAGQGEDLAPVHLQVHSIERALAGEVLGQAADVEQRRLRCHADLAHRSRNAFCQSGLPNGGCFLASNFALDLSIHDSGIGGTVTSCLSIARAVASMICQL
jgi:hypothetical protein